MRPYHLPRGASAIGGQADTVSSSGVLDLWGRPLHSAMARPTLADLVDVAGLAATGTPMASSEQGEHLGINPRWTDTTMTGGYSFEALVQHAAAAIATGLAEPAGPV
jgi:hypothetical protein